MAVLLPGAVLPAPVSALPVDDAVAAAVPAVAAAAAVEDDDDDDVGAGQPKMSYRVSECARAVNVNGSGAVDTNVKLTFVTVSGFGSGSGPGLSFVALMRSCAYVVSVTRYDVADAAGAPPSAQYDGGKCATSSVPGVSSVTLSWTGSNTVDVYRNGSKIISSVAGSSYTDTLGKVTGTFTHQVCVAGSTTSCSNTTTTTF